MAASFSLTPVSVPTEPVVSVKEFLRHARIVGRDAEEVAIKEILHQAEDYITSVTNHCFQARTYIMAMDRPPLQYQGFRVSMDVINANRIELPRFPLIDSSVSIDLMLGGVRVPFTDFQVSAHIRPGRIAPLAGRYWPFTDIFSMEGIRITFSAGYSSPTLVPHLARQAIKSLAGYWYLNRELAQTQNVVGEVPVSLRNMLNGLKE
jgi:hypothetical protein